MIWNALASLGESRLRRCAVLMLVAGALASGCATQPAPEAVSPPGFLMGLVHGFIIVFSFVGSLFTDVRIYAYPNSGWWYDLGYLLGTSMFLGGGGASSKRR